MIYILQARAENISGNLSGDGLQNGGLLIVTKGGEQVLLNHREETPGDHVANAVILETLGLKQENARKRLDTKMFQRETFYQLFPLGISPKPRDCVFCQRI